MEKWQMSADLAALEFANDAFYQAFAAASLEAMAAVWAEQPNVFCVHPGWPPITSRDEVMASWHEILSNAGPIPVRCVAPKATIHGDIGLVCCYERFANQHLVASNLFIRANGGWRMIHHHAGPLARVPDEAKVEDQPRPRH
jgi:ketosteroid isomerase-like protein